MTTAMSIIRVEGLCTAFDSSIYPWSLSVILLILKTIKKKNEIEMSLRGKQLSELIVIFQKVKWKKKLFVKEKMKEYILLIYHYNNKDRGREGEK